ncbi:glutamine--fructose-6-phosphate transaminase (isomerizing) [Roseobacter sp. HKCCD9010]|uniref:glutamine--fructose-6-phosphate transaminase (isomerizing) n=1 Tax=unclassified Roseobacter TaxID=196798 RepID=UPI001492CE56|nr:MULTISPECIES: glutamine--fructose-6-phosphate transaminase (isomerizing) [unclassified Roseobacter]MBF9049297.1 glutamine--fructose-6-phosphate transaminase (isomerizing) [Rhodobacterales bacterium HKCCD4356]NNV11297.1 glutamine--fructose-6-phosphate transaminase (isomerizing) [Roseobacter sp. HKCCD7357]NNV15481.1 glutamine--fructose-6-phosphate transaminase (isomerizing) [Roseobacter sp. HKCCD8768]NNV24941.1 glutamine--fructose-6-phosphate transaminase (isomerizing) [Roseobacter sp. HKCCD81
MCGIVGVLGDHEVAPILVEALKRLEYRGYDSAGLATVQNGTLDRRRAVGKLVNLSDELVHNPLPGKSGIGHTRWATHGGPTVANAHPHRAGRVAVVHNGIIENFRELRDRLNGAAWESETDTETVAQLCEHYLNQGMTPRDAAVETLKHLEGAFALAFLFQGEGDLIVAARKGSPLAIGHGDGEMYVGSDAIALSPMTNRITYLEEGDYAFVTREGAEIYDAKGRRANRELREIAAQATQIDKGGHRHFMAKEVFEQPTVLADCLAHYAQGDTVQIPEGDVDFSETDRVILVACGTANYACLVAKYWFEQLAGLPCDVDIASEFRYREPPVSDKATALFVSQSGETADTLAALRYAEGKAARILSVVNVAESSIARESDLALPLKAGVEVGVASTKAFICQLGVLANLAILAGRQRGRIDAAREADMLRQLRALPALINQALALEDQIKRHTRTLARAQTVLFLGRGAMFPLALEGALKLKEISYIHAEGYASGELKHGPIALVDKTVPVVVLAPRDALFDKTVSNMQEVMARDGKVWLVTDKPGAKQASDGAWKTLVMPEVDPFFAPILYSIPAQLIAYHTAVHKGTDVDQPRNLAKSVTVE